LCEKSGSESIVEAKDSGACDDHVKEYSLILVIYVYS
jgi:hypothetical protein